MPVTTYCRNRKQNRQQPLGDTNGQVATSSFRRTEGRAESASSRAPSVALSIAPSDAPAPEADAGDAASALALGGVTTPAAVPTSSTADAAVAMEAAEATAAQPAAALEAAERPVATANGPVAEQAPQAESAGAAPKLGESTGDAGSAGEAAAVNGLTPQQTADGAADSAANEGDVLSDAIEQRKPAWNQPATAPKDQAQQDMCAVVTLTALCQIWHLFGTHSTI